eukprot:GFUD01019378.1.p1 GENE.GFUD01019378.1~~GFUD01019378.1.p1  ORF type:complete len:195 (+),score=60.87 GFUD01019378.1:77-661(+)
MDNPPPYNNLYGTVQPSAPQPNRDKRSRIMGGEVAKKLSRQWILTMSLVVIIVMVSCSLSGYSLSMTDKLNERMDVLDAGGEWPNLAQHMAQLENKMDYTMKTIGEFQTKLGVLTGQWKELSESVGRVEEDLAQLKMHVENNGANLVKLKTDQNKLLERLAMVECKVDHMSSGVTKVQGEVVGLLLVIILLLLL